MAGNRKLTDFFRTTTATPKVSEKDDRVGDTIIVARNNGNDPKYSNDGTPGLPEGKPSHRGSVELSSGTASEGQVETSRTSSQSATTKYKPMVKKSKLIVRSSDSEDTDSDSSFGDLDDLLNPPKALAASAGGDRKASTRLPDRSSSVKRTRGQLHEQYPRTPSTTAPRYKFSMASLVMHAERDIASAADVARARVALGSECGHKGSLNYRDELSVRDSQMAEARDVTDDIHRELITSIISEKGEEGGFQKVIGAMKRTEALSRNKVWYFFEHGSSTARSSRMAFPMLRNVPTGHGDALTG
ncbi:hypothetical protein GP486_002388 [Trichoglossum hirsutum]|uniref:Uncharacterized protein n=1 Tax=Trichoglossum hirsutum TaxID=265104 RepID=A0A9P8LF12_9PEZI|nr:hypothetical protein GP486_002388 [Trichoglossum hirsutum]